MKKIKKKKKTLSNHLKAVVIQAAESVQFVRAESAAGADLVESGLARVHYPESAPPAKSDSAELGLAPYYSD